MITSNKAYLSSSEICLPLHTIRQDPMTTNTHYNNKEIKVITLYNYNQGQLLLSKNTEKNIQK